MKQNETNISNNIEKQTKVQKKRTVATRARARNETKLKERKQNKQQQ